MPPRPSPCNDTCSVAPCLLCLAARHGRDLRFGEACSLLAAGLCVTGGQEQHAKLPWNSGEARSSRTRWSEREPHPHPKSRTFWPSPSRALPPRRLRRQHPRTGEPSSARCVRARPGPTRLSQHRASIDASALSSPIRGSKSRYSPVLQQTGHASVGMSQAETPHVRGAMGVSRAS